MLSLCGVAASASAQPRWGRERMPQNGACFFEDRNFGGRYFCVRPGEDLRVIPSGMNDRVSSIRLLGASEVTVFRDNDMRGRSVSFTHDVADLKRDGWNDAISSIAVSNGYYGNNGYGNNGNGRGNGRGHNREDRNGYYNDNLGYNGWNPEGPVWGRAAMPREGACFYEDANYRGRYFCVPRGGVYSSLPNGFNDRISSVRVFGASVQLFDDRDMRGRSTEIRRDDSNLKGRWRDAVSSIRVF